MEGNIVIFVPGTNSDDILKGTNAAEEIFGDNGNDFINGGGGDDFVRGGAGDDTVLGGFGNDDVNGGSGTDYVNGGFGDDNVKGGEGDDTVVGGRGDDVMAGGSGPGSPDGGIDTFVYDGAWGDDSGDDVIIDYAAGEHIWLANAVVSSIAQVGDDVVIHLDNAGTAPGSVAGSGTLTLQNFDLANLDLSDITLVSDYNPIV